MKQTYYFDVDGVLADFHGVYNPMNRDESLTYDFIRNLRPFAENIALVKALIADGNRVYISTMVANETLAWLKKLVLIGLLKCFRKSQSIVLLLLQGTATKLST